MVVYAAAAQLRVLQLTMQHPAVNTLGPHHDAQLLAPGQDVHGPVQHGDHLFPAHRLQEVVKGVGKVGIHRVVRRGGQINDKAQAVQLSERQPHLDPVLLRHHDVQQVKVEVSAPFHCVQQLIAGLERPHLGR